jgi:hypothetical protein
VEFIIETLLVASIVAAVDWVLSVRDRKAAPVLRGERTVYRVSRRIHVAALSSAVICAVLAVSYYENRNSIKEWALTIVFGSFAILGVWVSTGSVTTDRKGLTKKLFWHKSTMNWAEITEVLILPRDQGVRLNADGRQITVDMRFVGRAQLLEEVSNFTGLRPKQAVPRRD